MCRVENVGSLAGNIATCSDKSIVIDLHRPTTLHPYKTGDTWTWLAVHLVPRWVGNLNWQKWFQGTRMPIMSLKCQGSRVVRVNLTPYKVIRGSKQVNSRAKVIKSKWQIENAKPFPTSQERIGKFQTKLPLAKRTGTACNGDKSPLWSKKTS